MAKDTRTEGLGLAADTLEDALKSATVAVFLLEASGSLADAAEVSKAVAILKATQADIRVRYRARFLPAETLPR
jgi:hypothetical protein